MKKAEIAKKIKEAKELAALGQRIIKVSKRSLRFWEKELKKI